MQWDFDGQDSGDYHAEPGDRGTGNARASEDFFEKESWKLRCYTRRGLWARQHPTVRVSYVSHSQAMGCCSLKILGPLG